MFTIIVVFGIRRGTHTYIMTEMFEYTASPSCPPVHAFNKSSEQLLNTSAYSYSIKEDFKPTNSPSHQPKHHNNTKDPSIGTPKGEC